MIFHIFFYFLTVLVVGPSWNISSPTPMTPTLLSSIRWHIWGQSQAPKDRTKTEAEAQWPQLGFCRGLDKKIKRGLGGSPSGFPSEVPEWDSRVGSRRVPQGPPEKDSRVGSWLLSGAPEWDPEWGSRVGS